VSEIFSVGHDKRREHSPNSKAAGTWLISSSDFLNSKLLSHSRPALLRYYHSTRTRDLSKIYLREQAKKCEHAGRADHLRLWLGKELSPVIDWACTRVARHGGPHGAHNARFWRVQGAVSDLIDASNSLPISPTAHVGSYM
jgi:hypothetical protein